MLAKVIRMPLGSIGIFTVAFINQSTVHGKFVSTCLPYKVFLVFLGRECYRAWFEYGKFHAK